MSAGFAGFSGVAGTTGTTGTTGVTGVTGVTTGVAGVFLPGVVGVFSAGVVGVVSAGGVTAGVSPPLPYEVDAPLGFVSFPDGKVAVSAVGSPIVSALVVDSNKSATAIIFISFII